MEKELYVVVIDDDSDDVSLLSECFQKFHAYSIKSFTKGSQFFDFARKNDLTKICLFVIDLNLPEMDGVEILEKIKNTPILKSIPALVFTTGGTPTEKEICKKLNVQIFKKPSHIEEWESIALVMAAHCDPRLFKSPV